MGDTAGPIVTIALIILLLGGVGFALYLSIQNMSESDRRDICVAEGFAGTTNQVHVLHDVTYIECYNETFSNGKFVNKTTMWIPLNQTVNTIWSWLNQTKSK